LREFLGAAATTTEQHSFTGCETVAILGSEVPVNWKAMLDNFTETYHLSVVHRYSVADRSIGKENPYGYPLEFDFFGPHRYMGIWGNTTHKPAPIEGLAAKHGGVISSGATQHDRADKLQRHPNWQLDVFGIFPHVLFEMAPGFFFVQEFMPLAVDRTRWQLRIYLPKAQSAGQRFSQEYNLAAFRDTDAEDFMLLRTLQQSMASGAVDKVHFQVNEALCRHSYNTIVSHVHGTSAAKKEMSTGRSAAWETGTASAPTCPESSGTISDMSGAAAQGRRAPLCAPTPWMASDGPASEAGKRSTAGARRR
jgi:phenylpropionate dioxygenase-like ring-hydroxylating dioxygenase large terminal subunit